MLTGKEIYFCSTGEADEGISVHSIGTLADDGFDLSGPRATVGRSVEGKQLHYRRTGTVAGCTCIHR